MISQLQQIDPLGIRGTLKPGVIYFFKSPALERDEQWQSYVRRLTMASERRNFGVEILPAPYRNLEGATVARRYNIGNLAVEAYAWIAGEFGPTHSFAALERMLDTLTDVEDWHSGSIEITGYDNFEFERLKLAPSIGSPAYEADEAVPCTSATCSADTDPVQLSDDDRLIADMQHERQWMMHQIANMISNYVRQFHEMPPVEQFLQKLGGKYILDPRVGATISPVVVNGNLDIVLPYYNEMKLRLTPLVKILYLLFLTHPQGMRLKDIDYYEDELVELYTLVKPGSDDDKAVASIHEMCQPGSESLNQKLSMIRRAVKVQLALPDLLDHYTIHGPRGGIHRLPAATDCTLPSILNRSVR